MSAHLIVVTVFFYYIRLYTVTISAFLLIGYNSEKYSEVNRMKEKFSSF